MFRKVHLPWLHHGCLISDIMEIDRIDIVFRCYTETTHYEHIIRERQQRTTVLHLHHNYVWWLPLPIVPKASEGLPSAAHSLQNAPLTKMWSSMMCSLCGAVKKPSCYHTWKTWHIWNAVARLTEETQLRRADCLLYMCCSQS